MQRHSPGPNNYSQNDSVKHDEAPDIQGASEEKKSSTQADGGAVGENALTKAARRMGIAWVAE